MDDLTLFTPTPAPIPGQVSMGDPLDGDLTTAVDPRSVACPTCYAKVGSPCMRPSGHRVFGGGFHAPRVKAAGG